MKVAGVVIVILALVIGIVPQFTDCHSQGRMLTLANGNTVDMKCHWVAMAALALAVPLGLLGGLMAFGRRKETLRMLSALGIVTGAGTILLPTVLIGVCASNMMLCNMIMKPTLILSGALAAAISLVVWVLTIRLRESETLSSRGQLQA